MHDLHNRSTAIAPPFNMEYSECIRLGRKAQAEAIHELWLALKAAGADLWNAVKPVQEDRLGDHLARDIGVSR